MKQPNEPKSPILNSSNEAHCPWQQTHLLHKRIFQVLKFWPQVTFTLIERHSLTGPTDVALLPWVSGNFCALLHMCSVPLCLLQVSFTNMNLGHKYCAWCPFHSTNYFVCKWSISASRGVMIRYIQDLIQIKIHRTFYSSYWLLYWKQHSNLSGIILWFHLRSQRRETLSCDLCCDHHLLYWLWLD